MTDKEIKHKRKSAGKRQEKDAIEKAKDVKNSEKLTGKDQSATSGKRDGGRVNLSPQSLCGVEECAQKPMRDQEAGPVRFGCRTAA